MRVGLFAIAIVLGSFSPPPCQKTNPAFEGEDGGGSESGHEGSSTSGSTTSDAASGMSETSDASTTAVTDASGTITDDGTADDADGGMTESTESTTDGPCPDPGHELCSGTCVDTTTNRDHCGMCGHKCHPVMQNCENSMCVPV